MMRNASIGVFTLSLLLGATSPALASAAAKPTQAAPSSPRKETRTIEKANPRKIARKAFLAYLNSPRYLGTLDAAGKDQLLQNLKAPWPKPFAEYGKVASDVALLLEIRSIYKGEHEVELASRYGSKLVIRSAPSSISPHPTPMPRGISFGVIKSDGSAHYVGSLEELRAFGITKPKHLKKLVGEAMAKVAPEDYTR